MRLNYRPWLKTSRQANWKPSLLGIALTALLFGSLVGCSAPNAMESNRLASQATTAAAPRLAPAYSAQETKVSVDRCERGRCAVLSVRQVAFTGYERFNAFVDQALASMAWQSQTAVSPYRGITGLAAYFRASAQPGEQLTLETTVVRHSPTVVVLLLNQYRFDGGAHGESTAQYINWLLPQDRVVSLESMLLPGAMPAYTEALKRAHTKWIGSQVKAGSIEDAATFAEQWAFVPSDNAALMADGLRVSYPRYAIAPGFFGEPSLLVPYEDLRNIIKPDILKQVMAAQ
jgi:hypothetical protein